MKQLTAASAYDESVIHVYANARPAPHRIAGSIYVVLSTELLGDKKGEFQGIVTDADIAYAPQRIFADLINPHPLTPILEDTLLTEVEALLSSSTVEALAVVNQNKQFMGAVSRASLLKALLKQEQELLAATQQLNEQITEDNQRIASWSSRLSELHNASRTLLMALTHTTIEKDLLQSGLEALCTLLQAHYGAIGMINEAGELTLFLYTGMTDAQVNGISHFPEGKGLLGVVIHENMVIRIDDMSLDPRSTGFPANHPIMKSLLAVPISNAGRVYGRIYLSDKTDGLPFNAEDELLATSFATSLSLILDNAHEMEEVKRGKQHLYHLAHFDPLTNLPNRELACDRIQQALVACQRQDTQMAVLFADLDNFKRVNDSLGHSIGDELLKAVAVRLIECVRESDTVARLGGDEFVILLPNIVSSQSIVTVAQKIKQALQPIFKIGEQEIFASISIGASIYPTDSTNIEELLRNADIAMYHAKNMGRNNFQFFTPQMNEAAQQQMRLISLLSRAIERDELLLHYQPQIDLLTGKMIGVEALIRWQSPDLGMVSPAEFIPAAEASGLIISIGEWVLMTACTQGKRWLDEDLEGLRVAVNLSAVQFQHPDLLARTKQVLAMTGFPATLLELEITESIMMSDKSNIAAILDELKMLGAKISMDDFGTGYSSLSYLKRMPIDRVKIDQSFVRDIVNDPNDAAIVTAIIAMTHGLNLEVIAEGVETAEQLSFLVDKQCYKGQGYHFSKPVAAEEITTLWHGGFHIPSS